MSDKPNLDSLFEAAIRIDSLEARAEFVRQACGDNHELQRELELLLKSDRVEDSFLEKPPLRFQDTIVTDASPDGRNASLDDELSNPLSLENTNVPGDANYSVLRSLRNTLAEVPRVSLREAEEEGGDPVVRPSSPEIPQHPSESRYRIDGEIARGGMGAILRGRDTDLGRDLAIKVLLDAHKDRPEVIQRFIEEAQIGGQLQHPGIAPVYDLGQFTDQRPFFSMKLVKGQTLSKLLADRAGPSEDRGRLIGIFEQICQTMAYAHSRGVIHRDLKPANIMVGAFGEVQLMDWGLAKVLQAGGIEDERQAHGKHNDISIIQTMRSVGSDTPGIFGTHGSHTQMGSVMGTPAYMPPEQALGEIDQMDERADVFGLGAILCEVLTGKPPYVADDGTQVFRMASRGKLNECLARLDDCGADAELISLAKRCLELEPIDRPRDAGVLADQVTSYLESVEIKLREAEVERAKQAARADAEAAQANAERQRAEAESARASEESKRRRTSLAWAGSVLLLVGLGSGGWLYVERQAANTQRQHAEDMESQSQKAEAAQRIAEDAERRGRRLLYAANMQLASSGNNNIEGDTHGLLAAWIPAQPPTEDKPDLREFSWRRQWTRLYEGGIHSVPDASAAAISADGNLVTADGQGIREWFPSGELLAWRWRGDAAQAAFSPNGRWALVPSEDVFQLLNVASGQKIHSLEPSQYVFSADGESIAVWGSVGDIEVYKIGEKGVEPSGKISGHTFEKLPSRSRFFLAPDGRSFARDARYGTLEGVFADRETSHTWRHASGVTTCVWSADGQLVASGDDAGQIFLRGAAQPEQHAIIGSYGQGISFLRFSPDSTRLAAGRGNGTTELWDISITDNGVAGEVNQIIGASAAVRSVMFSADGTRLATLDNRRTATLWELSDPNGRHEFRRSVYDRIGDVGVVCEDAGGELRVQELLPDSPAARSGEISIGDRVVRISDELGDRTLDTPYGVSAGPRDSLIQIEVEKQATSDRHVVELACSMPVQFYTYDQLAISQCGKFVTVANSVVGATCWTTDGRFVRFYPAKGDSVRYSSDERFLALADRNEVVLWDLKNDQLHKRLPFDCSLLAFSPDARHLAFATNSSRLRVWELASLTQVANLPCGNRTRQGGFTPQGDLLIVIDRDRNAVTVWNTTTWEVERSFEAGRSNSMAVSPNGEEVAIGGRHVVELWNIRTGEFIRHIASPTNPHILAFSPDGRTLASGTVFWDGITGNPLRYYREHNTIMRGAEFSRDGKILATLSTDGVLYVQKAKSFAEIERHPLTLRSMYDLASLRAKQFQFAEAEAILRFALERQRRSLPSGHSDIVDSSRLLNSVLVAQDRQPVD